MEVMHQYELMRLLARLAEEVMYAARTQESRQLHAEITALAEAWNSEEQEYVEAVTRHAED